MKIVFLLILSILLFTSCGKKSDPEFQSKNIVKSTVII
jgi:PBP1b-binding outer membrane lipoprotein LpoB